MAKTPTSPLVDTSNAVSKQSTGDNWLLKQEATTCSSNQRSLGRECEPLPNNLTKKKE